MKTITYLGGGPDVIHCGAAGQFVKDVPRPVDDDEQADQLLGKNSLVFMEGAPETPELPEDPEAQKPAKPAKSAKNAEE